MGTSAFEGTSASTSRSPTGSSPAQVAILSTSPLSVRRSSPTSWMSAATASGSARAPRCRNCSATHPCSSFFTTSNGEHGARLRARLPERRARLQLVGHEREHGRRRGAGEVRRHGVDVRGLPASLAAAVRLLRPSTSSTTIEASVTEQAPGVAEPDGRVARRVERGDRLDRLGVEVAAQPRERRVDLRAVAPGDEVDGLVGRVGHVRHLNGAPVDPARFAGGTTSGRSGPSGSGRRTRRRRGRRGRCGRHARPGAPASAARVSGRGWP